jgi:hypothetical protein
VTENIAKIAAGLTKAQRDALVSHKNLQSWGGRDARPPVLQWPDIGHVLRENGLIRFPSDLSSATILTELGLAVRAYLENSK